MYVDLPTENHDKKKGLMRSVKPHTEKCVPFLALGG